MMVNSSPIIVMMLSEGNSSIKDTMTCYSENVQMSEMQTLKQSRTNLYESKSTPKECLYFPSDLETNSANNSHAHQTSHTSTTVQSVQHPEVRELYAPSASGGGPSFRVAPSSSSSHERTYEIPFLVTKVCSLILFLS